MYIRAGGRVWGGEKVLCFKKNPQFICAEKLIYCKK